MKFKFKTALCFAALLAIAYSVGGSLLIYTTFNSSIEEEKLSALNSYKVIRSALVLANEFKGISEFSDISDTVEKISNQYAEKIIGICLKKDETVIYRKGIIPYNVGGDLSDEEYMIRTSRSDNGKYYIQLSGYISVNHSSISLDVTYDISDVFALSQYQSLMFQRILIAMVIIGTFISLIISSLLTKPLDKLTDATRQIALGNISCRAIVHSGDEFEQLAGSFNNMADELEKKIDELKDAMYRQEKFMGSFAHELKTPMTSIIGYSDLLRSQMLTPAEFSEASNYIFNEGKRLESLSLKLLDLIVLKKQDFTFKPASPGNIIKSAVVSLKNKLKNKNIEIKLDCADGTCLMEPDLVKSLIINLVDNAIKAVENGGLICISSDIIEKGCIIKVSDNGRGIPSDEISKITQEFYRVDKSRSRAQGGVGLGLALCSEIVSLHGGSIKFDSRLGQGTCVTVLLNGGPA